MYNKVVRNDPLNPTKKKKDFVFAKQFHASDKILMLNHLDSKLGSIPLLILSLLVAGLYVCLKSVAQLWIK